ncbi:hypothetical protein [Nocardia sp. CY41]|uniref:hypothetical protein n=1 Tax=Nocardia sp. CY41 TaxID=2608686 RepID=UPI001356EAC1|nr:hypothetical protein [Nocardia sp. CY41]
MSRHVAMRYAQRPLPPPTLPPSRLTGWSGGYLGGGSRPERAHMSPRPLHVAMRYAQRPLPPPTLPPSWLTG